MGTTSPGTAFEDLPTQVERRCCLRKIACGTVTLLRRKQAEVDQQTGHIKVRYAYVRESNDEAYWSSATVDGLIECLNDPDFCFSKDEQQERKDLLG